MDADGSEYELARAVAKVIAFPDFVSAFVDHN